MLLGVIEDSQVLEGSSYPVSSKVLKRSWVMSAEVSQWLSLRGWSQTGVWSCKSSFSCPGTSWQNSLLCGWVKELISRQQELNREGEAGQEAQELWEVVEVNRASEDENAKRGSTQELAHEDGAGSVSRANRDGKQAWVDKTGWNSQTQKYLLFSVLSTCS